MVNSSNSHNVYDQFPVVTPVGLVDTILPSIGRVEKADQGRSDW